jgi:hypothetical protein
MATKTGVSKAYAEGKRALFKQPKSSRASKKQPTFDGNQRTDSHAVDLIPEDILEVPYIYNASMPTDPLDPFLEPDD